MRVALLSQDFPPASYGGIASSCFDLANNLQNLGINVDIFSTIKVGQQNYHSNNGLKIKWFPKYASAPRLSLIFNSSAIISSVAKSNPDIIHVFGPYGPLVSRLKKNLKKPIISNIHGVPYRVFNTFINSPLSSWSLNDFASNLLEFPISSSLMKTTLEKSNHVVFPSLNCLSDTLSSFKQSKEKVSVIINGVDFNAPYYKIQNKKSIEQPSSIVYCGRLTWVKGVLLLIKSFSILAEKNSKTILRIIGNGSLESHAQALVSKLGLKKRIVFLGKISRENAIMEMHNAAFLALPSLSENCPVVVCEAMSLGKPVVAFDLPFSRALITDNYSGLLAQPFDLQDFADKMGILLKDDQIRNRFGLNAYLYAKEKFDWSKNVVSYISLYNKYINHE
jgi:glycosyltransferase involved in cell wall biosynthesis